MNNSDLILVINPGSTSTKIALYDGTECISLTNLSHNIEELKSFERVYDQKDMRTGVILDWLGREGFRAEDLKAAVGRGGLLRSIPGGTYKVTEAMLSDLKAGVQGEHASNLGGIIASEIAEKAKVPAFIVDPVAVDEYDAAARISGMKEITRKSLVHALNIKAVTREICRIRNLDFSNDNFVVAHLGGGFSIVPMRKGRIIDANNANEEGPFSPERTGTLPVGDLVRLAFSGKYTYKQLKNKLNHEGGLAAYLNTNDARDVEAMIKKGDKKAELVYRALAYQIGKEIGAAAAALKGEVDSIILTGGLAYSSMLMDWVSEMVSFIAPIDIVPGEKEMSALAEGALRVLKGEEKVKIYEDEVISND